MIEGFASKMAKVLAEYSVPIRKGDYVRIAGSIHALPLVEALFSAVLRRGGNPSVELWSESLYEIFLREASDEQIAWRDPALSSIADKLDVYYGIVALANTRVSSAIDPVRVEKCQQALRPFNQRIADGTLRWNNTIWPTNAAAQEADMGLLAYQEFVYKACGLDQPDPVAYWEKFRAKQARLVAWLKGKSRCEVRGPGIDLTFSFAGRPWANYHGEHHFPDGEIFTSPLEDSVNGQVEFSYPAETAGGSPVSGVKLVFKDGVVVQASAKEHDDVLQTILKTDDGARRIGLFGIGTNTGIQKFVNSMLFDVKIAGTVHLVLGQSMSESGGVNQSAMQWAMLQGMQHGGEIMIDGELFYRSGEFLV